jgi:AcrR family transcriptional regulator
MPKVVDHEQRRRECEDALWRVVSRDGASAVSVRSVAAEAGMSPTNLTHYFSTRAELLGAVVRRHVASVRAAAGEIGPEGVTVEQAIRMLMAVIPTTPIRRRQSEIWLLLVHERQSSDVADGLLRSVQRLVQQEVVAGLEGLRRAGFLGAGRRIEDEALLLHALIDGLSVQSLSDPRAMNRARVRRLVTQHIEQLTRPLQA